MRAFLVLTLTAAVLPSLGSAAPPVDFNRQIRPVLARCLKCHGPDAAQVKGGLRLDERGPALAELDSGSRAIVPGKPAESELLARIGSKDPDTRMPPASEGAALTPQQVKAIKQWIAEGAKFERHWSFSAPRRKPLPTVRDRSWPRTPADMLVLARLEREGIKPSPQADRYTLIRRVSLDLTGLPPTIEEVDRFLADRAPGAYERLVDRLLQSPAYGERWGRIWLDLARYADSAGYAQDPPRVIWRYRDWVIQSLNDNLSFDQYTIQQLAGDMLPKPTERQLIATAFHRNTMTNSEGGTDDEEFRNAAVIDRVNTTMQVWMGLTMGCAQCHSHKYDPITQKEYFQFLAIFNNTEDSDKGDERPTISSFRESDLIRREMLQQQITELQQKLKKSPVKKVVLPKLAGAVPVRYIRIELPGSRKILSLAEVQVFAGADNVALKGKATQSSIDFSGPPQLAIDGKTSGNYEDKSVTHTATEDNPWWELDLGSPKQVTKVAVFNRTDNSLQSRLTGARLILLDKNRKPFWMTVLAKAPQLSVDFAVPQTAEARGKKLLVQLQRYLDQQNPASPDSKRLKDLQKALAGIRGVPTPILRELTEGKRRKTHIQIRGNFLDKSDEVQAGVPGAFHSFPASQKVNRLSVAKWIVSRDNPLTARVIVNRYWEHLFGIGLVETSEDFGRQGEPPSNQDLLDHLAVEFMDGGWDSKALLRTIVTSSTYRQTSKVSKELVARDRYNRLLARGPRFRVSAEMVRDQALAVAGLLSRRMYGPSVRPPRPVLGLRAAFGGSTDWATSPGEDRYRRGLYTSWRRTTPYPSMTTFDAPSREVCTIRRVRTNTPLQALVTMNDPVFIEAAQALARRSVRQSGTNTAARIRYAFRACVSRPPSEMEEKRLLELYQKALLQFQKDPKMADQLATDPIGPVPAGMQVGELAALTLVSNVLMNLDEFLARK